MDRRVADGLVSQPSFYARPFETLRRPAHINTMWMLSDFTPANGATWSEPPKFHPSTFDLPSNIRG